MTSILVIEDAHDLRLEMVEILQAEGFDALGAENGVIGLTIVEKNRPNLIICDLLMPELDGYGVLQALRSDPETRHIPVIVLTAKIEHADKRHSISLGANDFLTKPFMVEDLLASIHTHLGNQHQPKN